MKKTLIIFTSLILFNSCVELEHYNRYLKYHNIVILSDMSSRLTNRPPKDLEEIRKIMQFFKDECVKPGEKIGDKSSILFSTFSEKVIASIDIGKIKGLAERQQFINSAGKYQNNGLSYQIDAFEQKIKNAYVNIRNPGLDLISMLIEKIENEPIIKKDTFLTNGIDTTFINYENHLYIFTDGYLEYANKSENGQFHFGGSEIKNARQFCVEKGVDIIQALELNKSLCLPSYKSDFNQFIHLHILETHERDKNEKLQTYKFPKGLRDNEILESVWRKWAKDSGFKCFSWKKY